MKRDHFWLRGAVLPSIYTYKRIPYKLRTGVNKCSRQRNDWRRSHSKQDCPIVLLTEPGWLSASVQKYEQGNSICSDSSLSTCPFALAKLCYWIIFLAEQITIQQVLKTRIRFLDSWLYCAADMYNCIDAVVDDRKIAAYTKYKATAL